MVDGLVSVDAVAREQIRDRIAEVERQVDAKSYRPGPWDRLLKDTRALPRSERVTLKEEITRVSSKLHRREGRRTFSATGGLVGEIALTVLGGVGVVLAIHNRSNVAGIIGAVIWMTTFQPLVKVGVGYLLGVEYEYAYLYGVEPRFKMRFGDYIAAPRWARILLHLSGTIGSPLGTWLVLICLPAELRIAIDVCRVMLLIVIAINVAQLLVTLAGVKRIGAFKASFSSAGSAAMEIREALEIDQR